MGRAQLAEGRVDFAVAEFERAIVVNPTDPVAHLGLARAFMTRGDRAGAQAQFAIVRRLDPPLAKQLEHEFR